MFDINSFNEYKIKRETIEAIADKLRVLVGKKEKLTPDEIIYYLGRVIFTPQTYAKTIFSINNNWFNSSIRAEFPFIHTTQCSNKFPIEQTLFDSNAYGILPTIYTTFGDSEISIINSLFTSNVSGEIIKENEEE